MPRSRNREIEFDDNPDRFGMDVPESRANGGDTYEEEPDRLELGDSGRKNPFSRLRDEDIYGSN